MKKNKIKYNCDYCGKECETYVSIYNATRGKHYCNKYCYWTNNKGKNCSQYSAKTMQCDYCGKDIKVNQYTMEHRKNHFCSVGCYNKWNKGRGGPDHFNYKKQEVSCANCGEILFRPPFNIKKNKNLFCNRKCQGEYNSKYLIGENHPSWKGGLIDIECAECGVIFKIKPSRLRKINVCSHECRSKWISNNLGGKNSWCWKGGISSLQNLIRKSTKMKKWIVEIFERDNYICQKCNNGSNKLNVHHLDSVSGILTRNNITTKEEAMICEELWDNDNAVTLCKECHHEFHNLYGRKKFTVENYYEWNKKLEVA